ncbi:unnamed protein product [Cyclocybe aegerita]|uniref:F-box domain-containing protein n=1 Tax=Cyclocybe aegerita TaxID=1973307 RepID=A0A8S0WGF1_CYCAE|nr:unnamed protein product [Cyclocybe aegerita]
MHHHAFSRRSAGIHSLPVELLTRFFVLGSQFEYLYEDSPFLLKPVQDYSPAEAPNFQVIVSQVCRHWRQIALRTPSLWTTLHFRKVSHIQRATTYLSRCSLSGTSNTYLLDILIDTVAEEDYLPGINLYKNELRTIFQEIVPHVRRWHAFHLKICDDDCKAQAREYLSTCGPAPSLETLQLYHFTDYRTAQRLYLATYRPPVVVFSNTLPCLKNVSLIGVNLPWDKSPFLQDLHHLELALHLDNIRTPYAYWDRMLRLSPELRTLCLHYSGPKEATTADPALVWPNLDDKIQLRSLQELSVTDLDPDYLCQVIQRLHIPSVNKLTLDLPDQNFTPFVELLTNSSAPGSTDNIGRANSTQTAPRFYSTEHSSPSPTPPDSPILSLRNLETLIVRALECSPSSLVSLLRATQALRVLQVDFARVGGSLCQIFTEDPEITPLAASPASPGFVHHPLLPLLEIMKIAGAPGKDILDALHTRHWVSREPPAVSEKWIVGWDEKRRGADAELDALVDKGYWSFTGQGREVRVIIETYDDEDEAAEVPDNDAESSDDEELEDEP